MSVVYEAQDTTLDRPVAVKILREQFSGEADFLERFRREARSAARLGHPNIIAIYDVGRDGGTNYIVMELVEGEDLRALIRREAPFRPDRIVAIGSQIAAAIDVAHRAGIVHRDIKSPNVLIAPNGHVKVADFGIAVALGERSITQTGMVIGSVHYMAPEQALGQPTSPATDVYSLGVVLYEMATGVVPFTAEAPLAVARMHIDTPPRPPHEVNPRLPRALSDTIMATLAKRPEARPRSAALVAAALRGQTTLAPPAAADATIQWSQTDAAPRQPTQRTVVQPPGVTRQRQPTRTQKPTRRGLGLAGFVALAILLGAIGGLAGWVLSSPLTPASPRPTSAPVVVATNTTQPSPAAKAATVPATQAAAKPTAVPAATTAPTPAPPTATIPAKPTAQPATPTGAPPTATAARPTATAVPPIEVPGVVAQSEDAARRTLEGRNLKVEIREDRDAAAPSGTVIGQDPAPGQSVQRGSTVVLRVSRPRPNGPQPKTTPKPAPGGGNSVLVPYVEGFTEREARQTLEGQGFKVDARREERRNGKGVVVDQNPAAGDTVQPGVTVRITIGE